MGLFSLLEEKRDSKKIAVIDRGISYTYAGLWNDVLETKHMTKHGSFGMILLMNAWLYAINQISFF